MKMKYLKKWEKKKTPLNRGLLHISVLHFYLQFLLKILEQLDVWQPRNDHPVRCEVPEILIGVGVEVIGEGEISQ